MRPLTLRMSGLRSYRSEVSIDFGDPGLIAIVGDTGAGKSSILEALFFVLYGGCTWDQRAVIPLISDGASVMQAELVFLAEDRRWRVFRSASRTGGQSRHQLECLDDPAVRFDNDGPVTTEIKRLTGLDPDAFLRTVILPQGRFQTLLQATRADRTAILKGIFRLDQLAAARDQADRAARRLRPGAANLKLQRAALLPDPEAALADARARHERARSRHAELQGLSEKITAAARQRDDAGRQASDLQERHRQVRATAVPDATAELANLATTASQLDGRRHKIETEREQHRIQAQSLAEILTHAEQQGEGLEALASAAAAVRSLTGQLPSLQAEQAECEREAHDLQEFSRGIGAREEEAASLAAQASAARAGESRLADAATAADGLLSQARTRLAAARNRAVTHDDRQEAAKDAAGRKSRGEAAIKPAVARARETTAIRDAARTALEAIQRAHAAAHAAEGCQPGDPCPVCQRPLPPGFAMPRPPGEADARAELQTAEQAAVVAAQDEAARKADLANATDALERAGKDAQQARAALEAALTELRQVLPGAELDSDDDTVLAPVAEASATATAARQAHAATANELAQQAEGAAATAEGLRQEAQRRSAQLRDRQESVRERKASCEKAASELPPGYRVTAPLTAEALAAASERIEGRQGELAGVSRQLAGARSVIDERARDLEAINDQLREQVTETAQQITLNLSLAEQRLNDLATLLGSPSAPARPADGGLAADAEWANNLNSASSAALTQAEAAAARIRRQHDEAVSAISEAITSAGVENEPELQQAIIDVSADQRRAAEDINTATEQIPRVAELTRKITQAEGLLEALEELTQLLSDGKFISYVVTRKQQTLLAIATELLGSMTGGRYGFSEAFEIVDRLTGLPRGVKTLSGGETFLASLALALGLVELAGRAGGRLDALFLDEGFGSLDANALSEALDALGRQAETGRLVAVISHLRSIAESMDRVLAVTTSPSGSNLRWLGGDQRDELITQDIEASLLT